MPLVVDASIALKWVLPEPDSHVAEALLRIEPDLLVPDLMLLSLDEWAEAKGAAGRFA